ncbi:UBA/THIF-type NAD/FAD binding protein [Pseudopedobacter saltans DSM 12145]|uniref:UBA/THIF-type NAD/FAD binding protein n=1 Tax=Pseudopedobacter saltans (strain ATCC 51119 / DSM 12145 / JCM 21818 / CCUG 39354 / LMG 10337 / NBRC 100064 / NCIMB 13643) TaxID=762903 RepID=F0SCP1_PSESL|nr:Rv1355c family protein [Pseudopedobacter saltans]ADY53885.1 UBA/THIF-type NAD/FAD binding protein [Pseudopedobacter saltans DSM 12145]
MKSLNKENSLDNIYKPRFYYPNNTSDEKELQNLLRDKPVSFVRDEIYSQLKELIKIQNPSIKLTEQDYSELIAKHLNGNPIEKYGVWVFYPWNNYLVHLLDKEEFVTVRTNRNKYKITSEEQDILEKKKIGIIGLSVGQSIALTIAMERICGSLKLADFDTAELSNLNRIRTGVHNLGLNKTIIAAREIAEIDPFLNVEIFNDGLKNENFNDFFLDGGKLDLLVEVCDGLDIKIESRFKARELGIPVIMETNDRGMLDVERFDLNPSLPILHGLAEGLNPSTIKNLSNEDKVPFILRIVGAETISNRLKASMVEVEQTINTWPQLASSVVLGGAVTTDISRRMLLGSFTDSGRYYIDLESLVKNKKEKEATPLVRKNPFTPLTKTEALHILSNYKFESSNLIVDDSLINKLVEDACLAPSTGNDQPWKWLYKNSVLFLFHDEYRSFSFGDYQNIASLLTFGAAYENLRISALKNGLTCSYDFRPIANDRRLIAAIKFGKSNKEELGIDGLYSAISRRCTNRNLSIPPVLPESVYRQLTESAQSIPSATIKWFKKEEELNELARIIGACDRIRLLNAEGHYDFVHHEMRWTPEEAESRKDGIDVQTLGLSNSQLAALGIIKSTETIKEINYIDGGKGLEMIAKKSVKAASAIALITLPQYTPENFFEGGRSLEQFWLKATTLGLAVHPLISPLYIFPRVIHGKGEGLNQKNIAELELLREDFKSLTGVNDNDAEVFLVKISVAEEPNIKSFRLLLNEVLL